MVLSGATTLGQSGPGSNGNEGVPRIPQSPSITGTSRSDCLVSYTGHSLVGGVLSLCSQGILQPQPTGNVEGEMSLFQNYLFWIGHFHIILM